ncbi:sulfite dehydrogenase [Chromatiales bacterium (ex Bugula neritina AB1)]|nr:sulfite dehydrogenase [Chromatiales bacterium (ex Bugula neritina AB1)]
MPVESAADDRRHFIKRAARLATLGTTVAAAPLARGNTIPDSWQTPGADFSNYGQPRSAIDSPIRWVSADRSVPGDGVSWTPLHALEGTITPNGLHFERHHNGVPFVDPARWQLTIHGKVDRALAFSLDTLHRYPMVSRTTFIECGGNSNSLWHPNPSQAPSGYVHGLVSCSEWTGVPLSILLDEAGIDIKAGWLIADGYDASGVAVSLPMKKILDDTLIALYQNGEPVRPENGYPARLLVPGWEGIVNIKWLRSLRVSDKPLMSRFDTVSYTDLQKDGSFERFSFEMGIKSLITSPTAGDKLSQRGFHQISGLAWTGNGKVSRVEVSVDNGASWTDAQLQQPVLDKSLTRFRLPWSWDGSPVKLKSRAYDSSGQSQPDRDSLLTERGTNMYYHYNAVVIFSINSDGLVRHAYS